MTVPAALIEFFQKEATEYLDRLDQLMSAATDSSPDAGVFLTSTRALRGSATMTRLDGLAEFTSTLERIATGIRDKDLNWDQRLHSAIRGALAELRVLVARANAWSEEEQRRCQSQSAALALVTAGYMAVSAPAGTPSPRVVPISRFFPDDGAPAIVHRNPHPMVTLAQRFRSDLSAAASAVAREASALSSSEAGPAQLVLTDGVRRTLIGLSDVASSFGAASIATLATRMARASLATSNERQGVQAFAQLLMNRELTDAQLAQQVKQTSVTWASPPAPEPAVVPIETLLYRGQSAVKRAKDVRDQLKQHWQRGNTAAPEVYALFEELSDLLDLAATA